MDQPSSPRGGRRPPSPGDREARARSAARASQEAAADEAAADEAAADEARRRLREQGIIAIEPDDRIAVMLAPGERLVAVRRDVWLERRTGWRDPGAGLRGDFYVTTRRLVHLGRLPIEFSLCEIREAVVAERALRLVVGENRGVEIEVDDPRLLRVEIAAVREAARPGVAPGPLGDAAPDAEASPDQGA